MILGLPSRWSASAYLLAALLCTPFVALLLQALMPDEQVFAQLFATVLPTYISNSLLLIVLVSLGALLLAVPAAWLVACSEFPGRRWLQWVLLLPLAMPAYLVAYVYTDLLDYAGPVQRSLRTWFGWQSPMDYWFPDVRSLGGAALMLALVLFPYIYLLARTAFSEQSASLIHAARVMGCSPWRSFWRLSLPMARPALAVGVALVAMETAADFATVSYFAVPTLTTAVYDTWLSQGSLSAAARLSLIILLVVSLFATLERISRRRQQLYQKNSFHTGQLYRLSPVKAWLATAYCLLLLLVAFLLPFAILLDYAIDYFEYSWTVEFFRYSANSLVLAAVVSFICALVALILLFVQRISPAAWDSLPARLASFGYALPGTVLAIGVLGPLTVADFAINDLFVWFGASGPGLVFTGTTFALVFAFCIRFAAIAIGSVESSYKRISPSMDMAAVTMGKSPRALFLRIHLPLLRKGLFAGMLLVFIEAMKELPAALLLRPAGYENLATHVFQYVSDEQLEHGALAAIVIVLVGLLPLIYLTRSFEREN
ncbi:MAG: iron ABC transporter permease [Shewanella sp.]|nr:iron ABC transporter permease [Shewanella sp.]MCF1430059.1 iron ABC transporter permease [Shewanella sp.]MCF1438372.1 iron ABC transporter permease [Shewanella sp.]MCF1458550.1 iron ABC transporter permease [Shewanella sp.]